MNKIYLSLILFLMMSSILSFNIGTTIYLYMPIVLLVWIFNLRVIRIRHLYSFEIVFILLYVYIIFSSLWSISYSLSLKLIAGEIILLLSYFILRYLATRISLDEFEYLFFVIAKWFTIISILLYIIGVVYYFIFNINPSPSMYLNKHSIGIFGLYLEGVLPRFRGLAESPNIYLYFSFLILVFFVYKKHYKLGILGLLSIILTISATGFLSLAVLLFLNSFISIKRSLILALLVIISILLGIYLYTNNTEFHQIIELRYDRILTGSGRYELWSIIIGYIENSPFLGYGANTTRILLENLRGYQSAHNGFLDITVTTGIVGLILYSGLYIILFTVSLKLQKFYDSRIFVYLYFFYLIISLSNDTIHIAYTIFYLFFIYVYYQNYSDYKINKFEKISKL